MSLEEKILQYIDSDKDHFFAPEWDGVFNREEYSYSDIMHACFSLVNKGVLKKRDCLGLAFERI